MISSTVLLTFLIFVAFCASVTNSTNANWLTSTRYSDGLCKSEPIGFQALQLDICFATINSETGSLDFGATVTCEETTISGLTVLAVTFTPYADPLCTIIPANVSTYTYVFNQGCNVDVSPKELEFLQLTGFNSSSILCNQKNADSTALSNDYIKFTGYSNSGNTSCSATPSVYSLYSADVCWKYKNDTGYNMSVTFDEYEGTQAGYIYSEKCFSGEILPLPASCVALYNDSYTFGFNRNYTVIDHYSFDYIDITSQPTVQPTVHPSKVPSTSSPTKPSTLSPTASPTASPTTSVGGWLEINRYSDDKCDGEIVSNAGVALGTCFAINATGTIESSIQFNCYNQNIDQTKFTYISYTLYNDGACSELNDTFSYPYISTCVPSANIPDALNALALSGFGSESVVCSPGQGTIDVKIDGDYVLWEGYASSDTCDISPSLYSAYATDFCFEVSSANSLQFSAYYGIQEDDLPAVPQPGFYYGDSTCSESVLLGLPDTCSNIYTDPYQFQIDLEFSIIQDYKFSYVTGPTSKPSVIPTSAPSLSPIAADDSLLYFTTEVSLTNVSAAAFTSDDANSASFTSSIYSILLIVGKTNSDITSVNSTQQVLPTTDSVLRSSPSSSSTATTSYVTYTVSVKRSNLNYVYAEASSDDVYNLLTSTLMSAADTASLTTMLATQSTPSQAVHYTSSSSYVGATGYTVVDGSGSSGNGGDSTNASLSGGAIFGIIFAVLCAVAAIAGAYYYFVILGTRKSTLTQKLFSQNSNNSNSNMGIDNNAL